MNAEITLRDLLEVQAYFGLPSPALVEKDFHVVKALAAIAAVNTAPLGLVFGGGTALARSASDACLGCRPTGRDMSRDSRSLALRC